MLNDKMIGDYSTQVFEKAQANLKEGTITGLYNDNNQVEQTVDNIFTPRDLDDELINKQLGDSEKMQQ